jgi:hypothetical protein
MAARFHQEKHKPQATGSYTGNSSLAADNLGLNNIPLILGWKN